MNHDRTAAYFSMEIGLENAIPTYSGGLGILAGDTIRSAADLGVPMVAVTLLHRKGYFQQKLDSTGWQTEEPVDWSVEHFMEEVPAKTSVTIEGRTVHLRAWQKEVKGVRGHTVPVYFLDADLAENAEWDRALTHSLYGGEQYHRICQEVILGIGGVRMLRALGYHEIDRFHMNEGHASFLTLELLEERVRLAGQSALSPDDIEAVRRHCVFTTHTPVPAGHDQFPLELAHRVLGDQAKRLQEVFCFENVLNMTYLALNLSNYVNGVAKKHGEVSKQMFHQYSIDSITNGVHVATWAVGPVQELFDRYIPGWREDNFSLRYALNIPKQEIWDAHMTAKRSLIEYVNFKTNAGMDPEIFTIGFARRATGYKRADLLFQDTDRLKRISKSAGGIQIVYAGKAHPHDQPGKELIKRIFQMKERLKKDIKIAYLENYDMELAQWLTSSVDIWLNTPQPPLEASGTSGMKAALNAVPSLSILDGWWIEGCIEGITGWSIGERERGMEAADDRAKDSASLYEKLEQIILPMFYHRRHRYIDVMRHALALNGSFFNTERMMEEYVLKAYFR